MKKLLLFLSIIVLSKFGNTQKGITYVAVGYDGLVHAPFEKIIGEKWIDNKDGTVPGMYYIVEYNYGEPPPNYLELVKSFLTKGDDTIRGWKVEFKELISIGGDCPMATYSIKQICLNKVNRSLLLYYEHMSIFIPGCGNSEQQFEIRIYTTKEEMERREKEINKH